MSEKFDRPYVISWNLTNRCNLKCEHCYLDAGAPQHRLLKSEGFADRGELDTEACKKIMDQIAEFAPETVTILTGGEPLLRTDILELIRYGAQKDLWVVCGTNGVTITENLARTLKDSGLKGMALSLDSLDPKTHDSFRGIEGAWQNTVRGAGALKNAGLPYIIQTTVNQHNFDKIEEIVEFAYQELEAKVFNLYFLVSTGRGQFVSDISQDEYSIVLKIFTEIQAKYQGKMLVNAKCAPHYQRMLFEQYPESPFLKTFGEGAGGCPAGTQYMGIRPNGDMTPCPYLPKFGGNLLDTSMREIWEGSDLFNEIRQRKALKDRCGDCEFTDVCGGCRARAFGNTGDYMQVDELCDYEPGTFSKEEVIRKFNITYAENALSVPHNSPETQTTLNPLGNDEGVEVEWDPEAKENMKKIPVFVRGMVIKRVEAWCQKNKIYQVTPDVLTKIRSRMPTKGFFSS